MRQRSRLPRAVAQKTRKAENADAGRLVGWIAASARSVVGRDFDLIGAAELWASREWALLGRAQAGSPEAWKFAADAAARAEMSDEQQFSAAFQSSVLAVAASDLARADSEAKNAIAMAPNWYRGHLLRSQILQFMGRNEEAGREAELSLAPGARRQ